MQGVGRTFRGELREVMVAGRMMAGFEVAERSSRGELREVRVAGRRK